MVPSVGEIWEAMEQENGALVCSVRRGKSLQVVIGLVSDGDKVRCCAVCCARNGRINCAMRCCCCDKEGKKGYEKFSDLHLVNDDGCGQSGNVVVIVVGYCLL